MASMVERIDRAFYPGVRSNWDDEALRQAILNKLRPDHVVLDVGAGAGILPQMNFKGLAARVCGVDLDPRVMANPMLDEGKVADAGRIPYGDAIFDLAFADNVLEHLDDPLTVLREVARVLKPNGVFIFKTPNKRHYMPTIARATPHWFHGYYNRLRGRDEVDTFPTHYRANTKGDVARLAAAAGLVAQDIRCIEGRPEYLRISPVTYLAGAAYERVVNTTQALEGLRVVLIGILRKPN